jgi:hypothetical protein
MPIVAVRNEKLIPSSFLKGHVSTLMLGSEESYRFIRHGYVLSKAHAFPDNTYRSLYKWIFLVFPGLRIAMRITRLRDKDKVSLLERSFFQDGVDQKGRQLVLSVANAALNRLR